MTPEQLAGFEAANHGISADALLLAIAMIVMTFFTLWTAWLAFGQAQGWWGGKVELYDLTWAVLRAAILLLLVGFFVRP
jgi:integrating conjugative element protein (TIGR03758 family)